MSSQRPQARWLLPVEAYTSEAWFAREQRDLFGRCWAFGAMTDDVPEAGDYACTQVGGDPIVVVRGNDRELRAFHNVCRHRGTQLLQGRGNVRRGISCFYHRWLYTLEGELKTVPQPQQFPDLRKEDLGLRPAGLDTWNGMVFVHPDPDAGSLTNWLAEFPGRMGPFDPRLLDEIPVERHELRANWKLFLENHVDGYHLWHLHAKSIKGLDHKRQEWHPAGRHWTFYEPASTAGAHADVAMTGLPVLPTHGDGGFGSSVHLIFPNLGVAGGSTFWSTIQVIPQSAERTTIEIRTRIAPMDSLQKARAVISLARRRALGAVSRSPAASVLRANTGLKALLDEGSTNFVAEDLRAAEAIQAAMRSSQFVVGPMAKDYESGITFFQQNILDYLDSEERHGA